ncbi:MAG: TetR family transcriptional regulator [Kordiimonadaceae bacterium]|nr:TetR family transcriptional regulator [Kordiimonadaceae bacterium]
MTSTSVEQALRTKKFSKKRIEVLRGAARVFARLGFHRASLNAVGDELEMTSAALYYYVKSKADLLFQIGEVTMTILKESVEGSEVEHENGYEHLRFFFRRYAELICDDFGSCFVLYNADDLPAELQGQDLGRRREIDQMARNIISAAIKDGSLSPVEPRALGSFLFGAINSLPKWYSADGDLKPAEIADQYLDIVSNGIRPQ